MNKKYFLIFGMIFLFGVLIMNFVSAEMLVSDAGAEYDSRIIDGFKNSSSVEVEITIKDNSGIIINSEDEDVDEKFSQQSEWLKNKSREMVNNFPRGEFNLSIMYARGTFKGNISENLFYELLNNSDVALVLYKTELNTHAVPLDENQTNGGANENDIPGVFSIKNGLLFGVIIGFILLIIVFFLIKFLRRKNE